MNNRFPLLSFISGLLRFVGFTFALAGVVTAFIGLFSLFDSNSRPALAYFVVAGSLIVNGLVSVATGELIGVLFAIENNTRETANRFADFAAAQRSDGRNDSNTTRKSASDGERVFYYKTASGADA